MEVCQRAPLAAQRPAAQPHEVAPRLQRLRRVVGHLGLPALLLERPQGVEQELPQLLVVGEFGNDVRSQAGGEVELGACAEPLGKTVAQGVVAQRLAWHVGQQLAHLHKILRAPHLFPVRQSEDEIAETKALAHKAAQALQQRLVCLVDELDPQLRSNLAVLRQRRLQHHRRVRAFALHLRDELLPGLGVVAPFTREAGVADDPQQERCVAAVQLLRLLHVGREQDFGAGAHPQQLVVQREATCHQAPGLLHQLGIELRQEERVEAGRVLDQYQHLHLAGLGVVVDVAQILHQLDNCQ